MIGSVVVNLNPIRKSRGREDIIESFAKGGSVTIELLGVTKNPLRLAGKAYLIRQLKVIVNPLRKSRGNLHINYI